MVKATAWSLILSLGDAHIDSLVLAVGGWVAIWVMWWARAHNTRLQCPGSLCKDL